MVKNADNCDTRIAVVPSAEHHELRQAMIVYQLSPTKMAELLDMPLGSFNLLLSGCWVPKEFTEDQCTTLELLTGQSMAMLFPGFVLKSVTKNRRECRLNLRTDVPSSPLALEQSVFSLERSQAVRAALNNLPGPVSEVVLMVITGDGDFSKVADALDLKPNEVQDFWEFGLTALSSRENQALLSPVLGDLSAVPA